MGPECQINEVRKGPKLSNLNVEQNVKLIWVKMLKKIWVKMSN